MSLRALFLAVALLAAALPAQGAEPWDPRTHTAGVMYFVSIPLDAASPKQREPVFGLVMRGQREREFLVLDTRMLNFIDGGISAKFLIAGAVAIGAAMAVGGGGSSSGSSGAAAPAPAKASTTSSGTSTSSSTSTNTTSGGGSGAPTPCPQVCPNK